MRMSTLDESMSDCRPISDGVAAYVCGFSRPDPPIMGEHANFCKSIVLTASLKETFHRRPNQDHPKQQHRSFGATLQ
jgi:hypothetical protein